MISAAIIEFMGYLSHECSVFRALLEDEVDIETGEIFPHCWMGRVTDAFCAGELNQTEQNMLLREAEKQLKPEDDSLSNLVAVSFVENLPPPQEQGYKLIAGYPALLRQYAIVFGSS
ncbi:hypothetical protein [Cypionkella sp.]|uniref:hypothetical protein n=1 Tax=Cypionkella sp. TaxID=2811411 RepID=UPI002AB821D4|nr:hypothetical protein [Cypionkella sp.]MDZ4395025.1 hypothetical protein [Cypionkella sp.]